MNLEKHQPFCRLLTVGLIMLFVLSGLAAAAGAFVLSAGPYDIESSVVDSGGGQPVSGGAYSSRGSIAQISVPPADGLARGGSFVNRAGFYNPPHFTFQKGVAAELSMGVGAQHISLPADSVDLDRFDITVNQNSGVGAISIDPSIIAEASRKMVYNEGPRAQVFTGSMSEMSIFNEQAHCSQPLSKRGLLTMAYQDSNNDGVIDGSNPPVRANTLSAWILDENSSSWVRMSGAVLNSDKTLSVPVGIAGVYAVMGALDDSVKYVYAYPVPFRPYGPQAGTAQGQTGTISGGITFQSVPQGGHIEIYTPDGRLVKKLSIPDNLLIPSVKWDVKTASGERAASGVYIWRVVFGSNVKTGKLMVIW